MALARIEHLTYWYPDASRPAVEDVSLELHAGEVVCLLGASGSGKSTLLRAFAGLLPHFHGGRFAGRVEIAGGDTRVARPADLAGTVASVFQDPEDQVVFTIVENEVAFGLENIGVRPSEIGGRALVALAALGSEQLAGRRTHELSAGELQRVCVASALALRPQLLLLDEPTSQLDPEAAEGLFDVATELGCAIVVSEQRPARPLERCDRVVFLEGGRVALDAEREDALDWLAAERPAFLAHEPAFVADAESEGGVVCRASGASYAYGERVVSVPDLEVRRGEIVALVGGNGSGKTTLAKLAAGLLQPSSGTVQREGRASYLSQDPGRYVVAERVDEEVALGVGGDLRRARAALRLVDLEGFESRHPRDLSSGERERLALAAVLVTDPDLLLLDEPTRGVDPERKLALAALLRSQAERRGTLVVTHDLVFAADVADRIVSSSPAREPVHA
ncbi:MAG TPA: ATP-binding cassette domain-containing protein [Gaiellaceae bacterium]